uniref:Uncharacterized protein n=1 Tax=Setaria italica TaxID=4555 RepID=K3ZYQ6_SETIT
MALLVQMFLSKKSEPTTQQMVRFKENVLMILLLNSDLEFMYFSSAYVSTRARLMAHHFIIVKYYHIIAPTRVQ